MSDRMLGNIGTASESKIVTAHEIINSITMSIINSEHLVISSFSSKMINSNYNYTLEIACGDDDVIICHYAVARIQKITPLTWNEEFDRYEVSDY